MEQSPCSFQHQWKRAELQSDLVSFFETAVAVEESGRILNTDLLGGSFLESRTLRHNNILAHITAECISRSVQFFLLLMMWRPKAKAHRGAENGRERTSLLWGFWRNPAWDYSGGACHGWRHRSGHLSLSPAELCYVPIWASWQITASKLGQESCSCNELHHGGGECLNVTLVDGEGKGCHKGSGCR